MRIFSIRTNSTGFGPNSKVFGVNSRGSGALGLSRGGRCTTPEPPPGDELAPCTSGHRADGAFDVQRCTAETAKRTQHYQCNTNPPRVTFGVQPCTTNTLRMGPGNTCGSPITPPCNLDKGTTQSANPMQVWATPENTYTFNNKNRIHTFKNRKR